MTKNIFPQDPCLEKVKNTTITALFEEDKNRGQNFAIATPYMYYDFSRQRINKEALQILLSWAESRNLKQKIDAMFSGEKINRTEERAVLHTALRAKHDASVMVDGKNVIPEVQAVLQKIEKFSKGVQKGTITGVTGKKFKNILAIGIGGSYLGTDFLANACASYANTGLSLRLLSNIDGTDFILKTQGWEQEETLIIIVSKTFTTAETMQNARTLQEWLFKKLPATKETLAHHCVAVTMNTKLAQDFGILEENIFGFWDWVGGRYSVSSAVGALPLSLYLGFDNFQRIMDGAHWMDEHFHTESFEKNIPVISALLDIWNINYLNYNIRAILPYSQALSKMPAYIQQGEMESNGKSVDIEGNPLSFNTGEVVFGESGTNGQHSFYQLLHQGTSIIPADFIGFICEQYDVKNNVDKVSHHEELMTNFFAQPNALAFGKASPNAMHKNFDGNRPSNIFLLQELSPFTSGIILAWIEHRIAVKGFLWGINSFDQFGVELGKVLGKEFRKRMQEYKEDGSCEMDTLDSSTKILLDAFLHHRLPNPKLLTEAELEKLRNEKKN